MEIWGHRGAYSHAPENTLTGFQIAADMGAFGVELDIQLTSDGEIVVIHDETVDRTSDGQGWVNDFKLSEIKKLNFNKRGAMYAKAAGIDAADTTITLPAEEENRVSLPLFMEIPRLSEVFELIKPTRLKINVEFKTGIFFNEGIEEKAFELACKYGMMERIVWSSFNHYSVQKLKQLAPEAETALLSSGEIFVTGEQCEKTGAAALHPNIFQLLYPGLVEECHSRGVKVRAWTIDEPEQLDYVTDLEVDGIITNRFDLM